MTPTVNGVSDQSAEVQSAHSAASDARARFEEIEAETNVEIATFDAALAEMIKLGTALPPALQRRRRAYESAVSAARALEKLTGQRTEDDISVKPFRRDGRRGLPAGVVLNVELWSETSLVLPVQPDPANSLVPKPDYLPSSAQSVPMRREHP